MIVQIVLGFIKDAMYILIVLCQYFILSNFKMDQNFHHIYGFLKDFVKNFNQIIVY